jgi:hypothetical protein
LAENVLATIYGLTTARQVWTHLANNFASKSRSRCNQLKRQLQTLQQGTQTCTEYLRAAKSLADQLAIIGNQIDDEDLISFTLNGLNSSYNTFVTFYSLATRDKSLTFEDFQAELLNYEILIENQNSAITSDASKFAFFTQKQGAISSHGKKKYGGPPKFTQYRQGPPRGNFQSQFRGPRYPQRHYSSNTQQPINSPYSQVSHQQHRSSQQQLKPSQQFSNQQQFFHGTSPRSPCQICGKSNHRALDCYHMMDYAYQGRHPPSQLNAMVAQSNIYQEDEQPWFADSGANAHITSELQNLSIQQPFQGDETVAVGNGNGLQIQNTGSSTFQTPFSNIVLKNILHCPKVSANLLSINRFCIDNHCYFILTGSSYFIKDILTGATLLEGPSEAGLYPIYLKRTSLNKCRGLTAFLGIKATFDVWHSRLGHPADPIVHRLVTSQSLPVSGTLVKSHLCSSCQLGKCKKLPFTESTRESTSPLQIIHSDVWSSPIISTNGYRYYVIFIDDYSRFSWMYPLHQKLDVFNYFVQFKNLVENLFSCTIKQFQSDGGGEYMSRQFTSFLTTHGIYHRVTCPHTPEQNGISERKHRHIMEVVFLF